MDLQGIDIKEYNINLTVYFSASTTIKNIIAVLATRFPDTDIHTATQTLETVEDIERLTQLHNTALATPSFNAFLQALTDKK